MRGGVACHNNTRGNHIGGAPPYVALGVGVAVALGVRPYTQQLGPVSIPYDIGFPISDIEGDEKQVLSFSAELPF